MPHGHRPARERQPLRGAGGHGRGGDQTAQGRAQERTRHRQEDDRRAHSRGRGRARAPAFVIMGGGPALYIGTIGGCVPSWVAPRPTCATSTTTAMPTTIRRRTPGFAPAPDSLTARPSRPAGRKQSAERKEGATIGREPVNTHPARVAGRCLHGAALRGFAAFHGHTSSGCQSHIASRAGCLL